MIFIDNNRFNAVIYYSSQFPHHWGNCKEITWIFINYNSYINIAVFIVFVFCKGAIQIYLFKNQMLAKQCFKLLYFYYCLF